MLSKHLVSSIGSTWAQQQYLNIPFSCIIDYPLFSSLFVYLEVHDVGLLAFSLSYLTPRYTPNLPLSDNAMSGVSSILGYTGVGCWFRSDGRRSVQEVHSIDGAGLRRRTSRADDRRRVRISGRACQRVRRHHHGLIGSNRSVSPWQCWIVLQQFC